MVWVFGFLGGLTVVIIKNIIEYKLQKSESTEAISASKEVKEKTNSITQSISQTVFETYSATSEKNVSKENKSVYKEEPGKLHFFSRHEEYVKNPGVYNELEEISKHPGGNHIEDNGNCVMTAYEYSIYHPEDQDHQPGSYFDRCANPWKY